jgi:hypothetical protein
VAPFAALRPGSGGRAWADLAAITGLGQVVATIGARVVVPAGWEVLEVFAGVQLVDTGFSLRREVAITVVEPRA